MPQACTALSEKKNKNIMSRAQNKKNKKWKKKNKRNGDNKNHETIKRKRKENKMMLIKRRKAGEMPVE